MPLVTTLGFPRIGVKRELKIALERYWNRGSDAADLERSARTLRLRHWQLQREAGADVVPVNDFSLYDHVLDTAWLVGAVPQRYLEVAARDPLAGYFAAARGLQRDGTDLHALEMTKWFDTNYHYLVPELARGQRFALAGDKPLAEWREARAAGFEARPVLLGPVSFLLLSKTSDGSDRLAHVDALCAVYAELLERLHAAGVEWVQLDEPCLVCDLDDDDRAAYRRAYAALAAARGPRKFVATYFGGLQDNLDLAMQLPVEGLHVDAVCAPQWLEAVFDHLPDERVLSLGLIDGRNIWRSDLVSALKTVRRALGSLNERRLWLAPSCSLLHVPIDLARETGLDAELRGWLAFARQKIEELRSVADACWGSATAQAQVSASRRALQARAASPRVQDARVRARLADAATSATAPRAPYAERQAAQRDALGLPPFPTTTIGSFPQTAAVRQARAAHRAGNLSDAAYHAFLREEVRAAVKAQEALDLDVLVHGEFERNDMVEYFGERLSGFAFTRQGWVQSYGSRCVKPPIVYGDVARPQPMTVAWSRYAQSLTARPMKGMLTGPVTILKWSFVRDDQPRELSCRQIALALRDEVADLEAAGIRVIQIDEPALREGLPLRRRERDAYLAWAVACFRLAAGAAGAATQVHTHMCYAEFNDIIDAVAAMDADVVSIETSRSRMELLGAFTRQDYPNGIGPGVYDIHSPRVPDVDEMVGLLSRARRHFGPEQLWVNPDCGLKTRAWDETRPALAAMVAAARRMRAGEAAA